MGSELGVFEEGHFSNFHHAVLRNPSEDIMAFASLFQGALKLELSLDLMRYDPEGAVFAMDALFGELMLVAVVVLLAFWWMRRVRGRKGQLCCSCNILRLFANAVSGPALRGKHRGHFS